MRVVIVALAVFLVSGIGHAESLKSAATSLERRGTEAKRQNNYGPFLTYFKAHVTPGFHYSVSGRTMTFSEMAQQIKLGQRVIKRVTMASAVVTSVKEHGRTGVTETRKKSAVVTMGADKVAHHLVITSLTRDLWVNLHGWKVDSILVVKQSTTLDGKPLEFRTGPRAAPARRLNVPAR